MLEKTRKSTTRYRILRLMLWRSTRVHFHFTLWRSTLAGHRVKACSGGTGESRFEHPASICDTDMARCLLTYDTSRCIVRSTYAHASSVKTIIQPHTAMWTMLCILGTLPCILHGDSSKVAVSIFQSFPMFSVKHQLEYLNTCACH